MVGDGLQSHGYKQNLVVISLERQLVNDELRLLTRTKQPHPTSRILRRSHHYSHQTLQATSRLQIELIAVLVLLLQRGSL